MLSPKESKDEEHRTWFIAFHKILYVICTPFVIQSKPNLSSKTRPQTIAQHFFFQEAVERTGVLVVKFDLNNCLSILFLTSTIYLVYYSSLSSKP